jgi:hypothetical protein
MLHNIAKILLVIFLFALSIWPVWGQTGPNPEERIQQMDERIRLLEAELEKLRQLPANPASESPSLDAASSDAAASPLATKLEELDQKLRILERVRELESEAAATKAQETPSIQAGKDGFILCRPRATPS